MQSLRRSPTRQEGFGCAECIPETMCRTAFRFDLVRSLPDSEKLVGPKLLIEWNSRQICITVWEKSPAIDNEEIAPRYFSTEEFGYLVVLLLSEVSIRAALLGCGLSLFMDSLNRGITREIFWTNKLE